MTPAQRAGLEQMAGSGLTNHPVCRAKAAHIIRAADAIGEREFGVSLVRARRRAWLTTLTIWQRKWQQDTRRPSRANHHDSIEVREKYVRCSA